VVRLDAIGDYVLFRGVLRTLRASGFAGYRLTVVGNQAWLPFARALDADVVDEWIGIEVTRHSRSPLYRAQVAWMLRDCGFELLVHPTYSPTFWADRLAADLTATQKVAAQGNSVNRRKDSLRSRIYDRLVPQDPAVFFEAYRNQEFVEQWLELPSRRSLPRMEVSGWEPVAGMPQGEFVAFHLDASRPEKEWPLERYQTLIRWVVDRTSLSVVLLGAGTGGDWSAIAPGLLVDGRGKTSLASAAFTLSRARAFVGNDSALLHIALAVGVPAVVAICFGQHYGRFVPYPPQTEARCDFVFPPRIEAESGDADLLCKRYDDGSFEDIREISAGRVTRALAGVLGLPSERIP
jgi:ADP-heptose:LPS heptosyltransferase